MRASGIPIFCSLKAQGLPTPEVRGTCYEERSTTVVRRRWEEMSAIAGMYRTSARRSPVASLDSIACNGCGP